MAAYLLDTTVISSILNRRTDARRIESKLQKGLGENADILISPIVFYEIARGLYRRNMSRHVGFFESLAAEFRWCDLTKSTWDAGARLWASCRKRGTPTGEGIDRDVLIAVQAREQGAVVVTNNIRHFQYLGVHCEAW